MVPPTSYGILKAGATLPYNGPVMAASTLENIRKITPLVHNITNYVVMNQTANALLAVGASPVMAHALEEVDEMVGFAGALVINIGTLSPTWVEAMRRAGLAAVARGIPIVIDPVGCGATAYRTKTATMLVDELRPTIIRGNASEILALAGGVSATKGVDSSHSTDAVADAASALARARGCVLSISGADDLIIDGTRAVRVHNGHPIMTAVTGMGCTASAITGACAAVNTSAFDAAVAAMTIMGVCGEIAQAASQGPGSFVPAFMDTLWTITPAALADRARLTVVSVR